ncbi:hypothetical protein MJM59_32055, partial [Salmonella enterica subsp. enterica serovar Montevideo]|nr:hypothetical protein [Salmonella enterica subsp. enterica serovar Montevideo]
MISVAPSGNSRSPMAVMALAVRHHWHQAGFLFWVSISVLAIVAVILWRYTLSRNLMDV